MFKAKNAESVNTIKERGGKPPGLNEPNHTNELRQRMQGQ